MKFEDFVVGKTYEIDWKDANAGDGYSGLAVLVQKNPPCYDKNILLFDLNNGSQTALKTDEFEAKEVVLTISLFTAPHKTKAFRTVFFDHLSNGYFCVTVDEKVMKMVKDPLEALSEFHKCAKTKEVKICGKAE